MSEKPLTKADPQGVLYDFFEVEEAAVRPAVLAIADAGIELPECYTEEFAALVAHIAPLSGSASAAVAWCTTHHVPGCGGTAPELVANGQAALVHEFLAGLACGAFA